MSSFTFDPETYKVINSYGGYDPNEKGLFRYPRKPLVSSPSAKCGHIIQCPSNQQQLPSYECQLSHERSDKDKTKAKATAWGKTLKTQPIQNLRKVFRNPLLDPATTHYKIFTQDPALGGLSKGTHAPIPVLAPRPPEPNFMNNDADSVSSSGGDEEPQNIKREVPIISPCGIRRLTNGLVSEETGLMRKPIDPVHWKPDLFDTSYEKYYLKNLLIEDPYREFLTSCSEATSPPHYCSETRQSYSGNPTLSTSSSGCIIGLSRPTDISEPCNWKRYKTQKLRDVVFTHDKDPTDSHLDYNDPKRYNPWPRLKMSYNQMLEPNYRPRPRTSVDYSVTTLLPAVSPYSKQWII